MAHLRELQTLTGHEERVWCVAWSPNGSTLASCGGDRTVRLWARRDCGGEEAGHPTWVCVATLEELHSKTVRCVAWSPCSRLLATASFDATVGIWERGEGGEWECVATLEGHENEVKTVAWSPCGQYLGTCGRDKSVWVWDSGAGGDFECAAVLHGHGADVKHLAWRPRCDPPLLLSCSYDDSLRSWREEPGADEWACLQVLPGAATAAKDAALAARAAAKHSGAASEDAVAQLAAEAAAAAATRSGGHASTVWACAWHPDGTRAASCSDDGALRTWRCEGDALVSDGARLDAHSRAVFACHWCLDGRHIATGGGDDALRVWAPCGQGAQLVAEAAPAHASDVNSVAWHPRQHAWLATGSDDGTVKVWELREASDGMVVE